MVIVQINVCLNILCVHLHSEKKNFNILYGLHLHQQTEIPMFLVRKNILTSNFFFRKGCEKCRKIMKSGQSRRLSFCGAWNWIRYSMLYACCVFMVCSKKMAESVTSDILLALSSNNPYHRELVFLFVGMKYRRCQDVNPSYMITRQVFKTII